MIGEECITGSGNKLGKWFRVPIYRKRIDLVNTIAMHYNDVLELEEGLVCIQHYSVVCSS